jgi:hypothetical protein
VVVLGALSAIQYLPVCPTIKIVEPTVRQTLADNYQLSCEVFAICLIVWSLILLDLFKLAVAYLTFNLIMQGQQHNEENYLPYHNKSDYSLLKIRCILCKYAEVIGTWQS